MFAKHSFHVFFLACAVLLSCTAQESNTPATKAVAEQIARQQLRNSFVTSVKQVVDLGRPVYKVFVQNDSSARRITVDAATARVIEIIDRTEELRQAMADGENVPHAVCPIARAAAEATALQAIPGGSLKRWKVVKDNDRIVHKFDIATSAQEEARITVDDCTQEILEIERALPAH